MSEEENIDVESHFSQQEKIPYEKRACQCPICHRVLTNPSNLRQHARRQHPEVENLEMRLAQVTALPAEHVGRKKRKSIASKEKESCARTASENREEPPAKKVEGCM